MSLAHLVQTLSHPKVKRELPNLIQEGSQAFWIANQINASHHITVLVTPSAKGIENYISYLRAMGVKDILVYPEAVKAEEGSPLARYQFQQYRHERHHIRKKTQEPGQRALIIPFTALHQLAMSPKTWEQATIELKVNQVIQPLELVQRLVQLGYKAIDRVTEPGEFTRRGGFMDIYPVGAELPYRLEWFDDEIERLTTYHLHASRQSVEQEVLLISPAFDWVIPRELDLTKIETLLQDHAQAEELLEAFTHYDYKPELSSVIQQLDPGIPFWQILPSDTHLVLTEGTQALYRNWLEQRKISENPLDSLQTTLFTAHDGSTQGAVLPPIERRLEPMARQLQQFINNEQKVIVMTAQPQRILTILQERECPVVYGQVPKDEQPAVWVMRGHIPRGFAYTPAQLYCLSDVELFGRQSDKSKRASQPKEPPIDLEQLRAGMFVVHEVHGIGEYQALVHTSISGQEREYLEISYASGDKLLVPVEQLNRLTLYHGVGKSRAKLNKMGGADWEKTKIRVKKAVADIAHELVITQAQRAQAKGFAYPPDSDWQQVLEMAFPYEETTDQLQAIIDTKRDMELDRPMDRLICGDVGFGKTEVAIRAAFKAVMAGKQVAFLAPTTVLAQQHYNVCLERFANFPVRIALLSRYKTKKEADKIFAELNMGIIDMVVATHRLLSKDVKFRDLGLMIIDEEHRFGVAHKERLKKLKANIDILTMSATPIPRTLHMAISGLRSLSSIETPPSNRYPIKTVVSPYQEHMVKSAILFELERGGQIYFVHNRVMSIYDMAEKIRKMAPQARVRVGHGQMSKRELEDVMFSFYNYECDILLSTTIVESGLDVPNANTLIVDRADRLGLAQIHQLRGRIGRSDVQGYAYLFYQANEGISVDARERLNIIQEFTGLGSGYYIALKDMEMRGIGDLLGARQHGRIAAVGFETYCQLLNEAVAEIKGEPEEATRSNTVVIDLNLPAFIPDQWIQDKAYKIALYRTLAHVDDLEQLESVKEYCISHYGEMPKPAKILWRITRIRILMAKMGAKRVAYDGSDLLVEVVIKSQRWKKMIQISPTLNRWNKQDYALRIMRDTYLYENNLKMLEQLGEAY